MKQKNTQPVMLSFIVFLKNSHILRILFNVYSIFFNNIVLVLNVFLYIIYICIL